MDEKQTSIKEQIKKWARTGWRNTILIVTAAVLLLSGSAYALSSSPIADRLAQSFDNFGGDSDIDVDPVDNYFLVDKEEYAGILLDKTDDAGESYLKETLFIGDSNTARIYMFGLLPMDNVIGVESMGINGALNNKAVYFQGYNQPVTIAEAVGLMKPRRAIINFGTNDLANNDAESFTKTYRQFIQAIQKEYKYTDLIIAAIPPFAKALEGSRLSIKTVNDYNKALIDLAKDMGLVFLDIGEALTGKDGYVRPEHIIEDGFHLSEVGFDALLKYARTHSHIVEDTRPKPLGKIPKQVAPPPKPVERLNCGAVASSTLGMLLSNGYSSPQGSPEWSKGESVTWSVPFSQASAGSESTIAQNLYSSVMAQTTMRTGYVDVSYSINETDKVYSFTVRIAPICGDTHSFKDWVVTRAATCEADGERERVCAVCGHKEKETIPATGHSWAETGTRLSDDGTQTITTYTCTVCGATYETATPVVPSEPPGGGRKKKKK